MTAPLLSARAYAAACLMHSSGPATQPAPKLADFLHLDVVPVGDLAPEPPPAAEPEPDPGWATAAFDALPADVRNAVMAGTASIIGRAALELEAEQEMVRPSDVHLHLTDSARYVDQDGRVDRERMRADITTLTRDRPELSRYGNQPGQESARPDERRRAGPSSGVGAGRLPVESGGKEKYLAMMAAGDR